MKNETTQAHHTKGKWTQNGFIVETNDAIIANTRHINTDDNRRILTNKEAEANAQRIVKAVNFLSIIEEKLKEYPNAILSKKIQELLKQAEQK